jgi:hypothetical protein
MGYNAGTAAAQHRGKKLRRALRYAEEVLLCERDDIMTHKTRDPEFHKEIEKEDARVGDFVWFYSDRGGFRHGIVKSIESRTHISVRAEGRARAERVPLTKVDNVYRDIFVEKERI